MIVWNLFLFLVFMVLAVSADSMQQGRALQTERSELHCSDCTGGSMGCESGEEMLPLLNCRCVIRLNVWSAWPHCCVLRYSIRRALKVCVLYLYYFLSPEEIFFFFLLLILAGNAKDLESILSFGKSDFLSSRKSECFRFVVTLKTWKIELWVPFNRKKKWLSLPRGIQNS